jgi:uncharacterized membrane protein SirB2
MDAMSELHAAAGTSLLAGAVAFAVIGGILAVLGSAPKWLDWLRIVLVVTLVLQAAIGLLVLVTSRGPAEQIHWLYGVVIVAVPVLAATFVEEAPPRPRAAVYAVAGLMVVALAWRLAATG